MQIDPIVALYRGWNSYEKSIREDGVYVIDFDLLPGKYEENITSRWDVLNKLISFRDSILEDSADNIYIKAKLNSSIYYLQAVMGENLPFEEYILNTLGISTHVFPDHVIEDLSYEIDDILSQWSLRYKRNYLDEFYTRFKITNFRGLEQEINRDTQDWYEIIKPIISPLPMPSIHFQFVNKNENWDSWIYGFEAGQICLDINLNPAVKYSLITSFPTLLATHELCGHALQMASIQREIQKGAVHPVNGLIFVHGIDMIQAEGLAHHLPELIPGKELDNLSKVSRKMISHRNYVLNNAFISLSEGESIREVFQFVVEKLPFHNPRYLELELKQWNRDPSMRVYRYAQGLSENAFKQIIKNLTDEQKKLFLRQAYTRPMTYRQILDYLENLKQLSQSQSGITEPSLKN